MTLQAVELCEGLAAGGAVVHDPEADLLLLGRNVLAFLLWNLWRRRHLVAGQQDAGVGTPVYGSISHRGRGGGLVGLLFVSAHVPVEVISSSVTFLAEITSVRPHSLVQLIDMAPEAVQLGKCLATDSAVILYPSTDFGAHRLGCWQLTGQAEEWKRVGGVQGGLVQVGV